MKVSVLDGNRRDALMNELEQDRAVLEESYTAFERDAETAYDELRTAVEAYNARLGVLWERHVCKPLAKYNATVQGAADFVRETGRTLRAAAGPNPDDDAVRDLVDEWERTAGELDPVELDEPPKVDVDDFDPRDKNDLPTDEHAADKLRALALDSDNG